MENKKKIVGGGGYYQSLSLWKRIKLQLAPVTGLIKDYGVLRILRKNVNRREKIVEIGCNTGHISIVMKALGYDISGVDISIETVEYARRILGVKFTKFDINCLDIMDMPDDYADVVWSSGLMNSLSDCDKVKYLEKIVKVAPKAIFIIPIIDERRPCYRTDGKVAWEGSAEFPTENLYEILKEYYGDVKGRRNDGICKRAPHKWAYYICIR